MPKNKGKKDTAQPVQKYVGPFYQKGLYISKLNRTVDPKKMTPEQVDQLIKDYPAAQAWFKE